MRHINSASHVQLLHINFLALERQ